MKPVYTYNPDCGCAWCQNGGDVPVGTPDNGHAFGYDNPHIPPASTRPRSAGDTKIVALLAWYDETPAWLERCVTSLAKVPIDHLIALDGAYGLYPGGKPLSGREQRNTITTAAAEAGFSAEVHAPLKVWPTELVKRDYLFRMAERHTTPKDWYMIVDADEYVDEAADTRPVLAGTPFDVAAVDLHEPGHPHGTIHYPTFPMFFRAIRGLHCDTAHFRYRTPDGRLLWGDAVRDRCEPRQMTGMRVIHETQLRPVDRRRAAVEYYKTRDEIGLENLPAERWITTDDRVVDGEDLVFGKQEAPAA